VVHTSQGQPVAVKGTNPRLGAGVNAALLYDSSCSKLDWRGLPQCTGRDTDLGTPNEDFGGPGIGEGGASGSPTENDEELHNLLIIATDLTDADADSLVDNPNDQKSTTVTQELDFAAFAPVSVLGLRLVESATPKERRPSSCSIRRGTACSSPPRRTPRTTAS